jgi:hypothetical protein
VIELYNTLVHDFAMLDKFQTIILSILVFVAIKNGVTISKEDGISFKRPVDVYIRIDDMKLLGDLFEEYYHEKEKLFYVTNKIIKDLIERAIKANHIPYKHEEQLNSYCRTLSKRIILAYRTEFGEVVPFEINGIEHEVKTILLRNRKR